VPLTPQASSDHVLRCGRCRRLWKPAAPPRPQSPDRDGAWVSAAGGQVLTAIGDACRCSRARRGAARTTWRPSVGRHERHSFVFIQSAELTAYDLLVSRARHQRHAVNASTVAPVRHAIVGHFRAYQRGRLTVRRGWMTTLRFRRRRARPAVALARSGPVGSNTPARLEPGMGRRACATGRTEGCGRLLSAAWSRVWWDAPG
jgi:hypothetical protein